ncbi:hypothetical protein [Streptomyces fumanus]|uniref:hypothetical protein n=1 Tax=Streptomyces fumanus TaxID=67302 RepID=UPI0033D19FE8
MTTTAGPERRSAPVPSGEAGLLIARQVDPGHEEDFLPYHPRPAPTAVVAGGLDPAATGRLAPASAAVHR